MDKEQALPIIAQVLQKVRNKPVAFSETTHLVNDKVLDSLDSALFFFELESQLKTKISDDAIQDNDLLSVANLLKYLAQI